MESQNEYTRRIKKVVMLGEPRVGKTSVIGRYVSGLFSDGYLQSIGAKVSKSTTHLTAEEAGEEYEITTLILDIRGGFAKENPRAFEQYIQCAEGAVIVLDTTRKETMERTCSDVERFEKIVGRVPTVFIANKVDAAAEIELVRELARQRAEDWHSGTPYFLASAKTGEEIENVFKGLARAMLPV